MDTEHGPKIPLQEDTEDVGELHEVQEIGAGSLDITAGPTGTPIPPEAGRSNVENRYELPTGDNGDQGQLAASSAGNALVLATTSAFNSLVFVIAFLLDSLVFANASNPPSQNAAFPSTRMTGIAINRPPFSSTAANSDDGYDADDEDGF
ncbi:hypothetical protein BDN72DRAFT_863525 [Pluteus cervinus]|uniref:Uncharacterized protein n=1 Tax=Pluteus cervinus TaxID=181527 RepID=A0ACD3A7Z9_9AGAR|nr:hypothetical protein BDN72DRAFT_863525 [Pluteus cervinus]